jgi:hypothetical protein
MNDLQTFLDSMRTRPKGERAIGRTSGEAGHRPTSALVAVAMLALVAAPCVGAADQPKNFFANPSFELGREAWQLDKAGKTECRFTLEENHAADGRYSARLNLGSVESWGVQFGQSFPAGAKGRIYTFAVFARSVQGPVEASLEIERSANPWDRAAGQKLGLTGEWQEFHVSFTVEKDFREGWFAYLHCAQPNAQVCADAFRLYEGGYVPYRETARQELAAVAVRLFDTGRRSPDRLTGQAVARRSGWTEVSEDEPAHAFQGDAVLMNGRISLALRRGARGLEAYSLGPEVPTLRAVLAPVAGSNAPVLSSFTIVENDPGASVMEVVFTTVPGQTLALRCELKAGQPFVASEARRGMTGLRVEAPCRFVVMPDFFADDIVVDAAELPVAAAELPSDNFLLHLLPDQQAMVMTVAKTSEEDVRVVLSGEGKNRRIESSELRCGKEGRIWVGILTSPAIWHQHDIAREQAGQVVRLEWKPPFPAQWRVDWRREENLTDSWEMLNARPDGSFSKPSAFGAADTVPANRKRWTTVLGQFNYPCWVDGAGQAQLEPIKSRALRFQGPALIYPMNRVSATALNTFTVLDVVRNTLGVGPCEYILDVEGQRSAYQGRATCSVRDTLNPIYAARQQKERRAEIEKVLQDLMIFIRHIRGRIESYVDFGHATLRYLAEQKQAHPELAGRVAELEALAGRIDARFAARQERIKTPDQAAAMVEEFRRTVLDYDGEDAPARCRRFTEGWVGIGENQDELVGECRWAVKMIRQRAGLLMAADPGMAEIVKEIRRRSQVVLRNPANHEGARH